MGGKSLYEGAWSSETEWADVAVASVRLLLKTSPEHVSSSPKGAVSATTYSFLSLVEGLWVAFFCLAKAAMFLLFWASNILSA